MINLGAIATFLLIILVASIEHRRRKERKENMRLEMLKEIYSNSRGFPYMIVGTGKKRKTK